MPHTFPAGSYPWLPVPQDVGCLWSVLGRLKLLSYLSLNQEGKDKERGTMSTSAVGTQRAMEVTGSFSVNSAGRLRLTTAQLFYALSELPVLEHLRLTGFTAGLGLMDAGVSVDGVE